MGYIIFEYIHTFKVVKVAFYKSNPKMMRFRLHDYHKATFVVGNVRRRIIIIDMHKLARFSWMLLMFD